MPISIVGNVSTFAIHQSSSSNGIQTENANTNGNQSQAAASKASAKTLNSNSTASTQGTIDLVNDTAAITGVSSNVCDFNLLPFRNATISSSGTVGATGATQVNAQTPKATTNGQNSLNANVLSAIPTVSSPVNNFPNPNPPFRVVINGGTTTTPFAGTSTNASAVTNRGNAASQASNFTINGNIARSHSIGQDGRVALIDQNGNVADPNNPAATPGYDPVTNTAPGLTNIAIFSGAVSVPNFFIPGPIPGDPNQAVPPATRNAISSTINVSSASQGQALSKQGKLGNLFNNNSFGNSGIFNSFVFSQIGVA